MADTLRFQEIQMIMAAAAEAVVLPIVAQALFQIAVLVNVITLDHADVPTVKRPTHVFSHHFLIAV